jgi:type I restriction enzyme, S subunit
MQSWPVYQIGDLCDLMTGATPSKKREEYFAGGEIKWLVSGDIHQRDISDCEGRITEQGYDNSSAKFLPINSVMIALNGQGKTRGTVALLRTKATCNQSMVSIYPKDIGQLLPEFLFTNLHGRYEELRKITGDSGNDRRGLNMPLIRSIKIPLPPLPEQQRIVAILDEAFAGIDAAVAHAGKNLKNARELFESYLNNVFTNKGEGWVEKTLGEHVDISHGYAFKGPDFGVSDDVAKPIVLTPGNYTEDSRLSFTKKNTKRFTGELPENFLFAEGELTVVMTDLSSKMKILGKPAFIEREGILHNQRIGRLIFNGSHLDRSYVFYFLRTKAVNEKIRDTSTGTMVRHTAPKRILSNIISYPPSLKEQHDIVVQLEDMEVTTQRLETIYQQKLDALAELKQSILQKAFSGELTQQDVAA